MNADPADIVQRQLDAFNARDLPALLATYAEDAELFEHPNQLVARGAAQLHERFRTRFQEPDLQAVLLHRVVVGRTVIDHETVHRTFPEGPGKLELVMIYEIQNARIAKAWSIAAPRALDSLPLKAIAPA